jgi:hypothetical protein
VTGPNEPTSEDPDKERFSFEVSLESKLETHPKDVATQRIASDVGVSPEGPNYQLINFDGFAYDTEYGFRGANILRPRGSFTLELFPEDSKVTRTYQNAVMDAVGKTNSVSFRKRAIGEVLMTSARGDSRNGADWHFSYTFEVEPTKTGVDLGNGVVFASVQGWDFIDPYYESVTTDLAGGKKATIQVCRQAIVWRVFEQTDLGVIFI